MIQTSPVWQEYHAYGPPIAVTIHALHRDSLGKDKVRCELPGSLPKCLALLRAVNTVQPNALVFAVVQHGDGVAVRDAHHAAGEVGGERMESREPRPEDSSQVSAARVRGERRAAGEDYRNWLISRRVFSFKALRRFLEGLCSSRFLERDRTVDEHVHGDQDQ